MKKEDVAGKMKLDRFGLESRLKKADEDYSKGKRRYHPPTFSDTQDRKQKGRESLNSPKRGRDNDVALGKNEQEKSWLK